MLCEPRSGGDEAGAGMPISRSRRRIPVDLRGLEAYAAVVGCEALPTHGIPSARAAMTAARLNSE